MRYAQTVVPATTAKSIVTLLSIAAPDSSTSVEIMLQCPAANGGNINFGTKASQPGFIIPGGNATIHVNSLKNLYVKGDGVDSLILLVTR